MSAMAAIPNPTDFKLDLGTYQLKLKSIGFGSNRAFQLISAKKGEEDYILKLKQAGILSENNYVDMEKLQKLFPDLRKQIENGANILRYYPPNSTMLIEGKLATPEKFYGNVKAFTPHEIQVFSEGAQQQTIDIHYFSDKFRSGNLPLDERERKIISSYIYSWFKAQIIQNFGLSEDNPLVDKITAILYDSRDSKKGGTFNCSLTGNTLRVNGQEFNLEQVYQPKKPEVVITKEEWDSVIQKHGGLYSFENLTNALKDPEFRLGIESISFQRAGMFGLGAIFTINLRKELGQEPIIIRTSIFNLEPFFKIVEAISTDDFKKAGEGIDRKQAEQLFTKIIKSYLPTTVTFADGKIVGLFPEDRKVSGVIPIMSNDLRTIEIKLNFAQGEEDKFLQNISGITAPDTETKTKTLEILKGINGSIELTIVYEGKKPITLKFPFSAIGLAQGFLNSTDSSTTDSSLIEFQSNLFVAILTNKAAKIKFEKGKPPTVE